MLYAGTSKNPAYVTLAAPITGNLYRTVVHLACSKTGATDAAGAVANTWSFFVGPGNVNTWDGQILHYYQTGIPWAVSPVDGQMNTQVYQLLRDKNGQCNSWRELLESAWAVNGIASQGAMALPTANGVAGFLVKKFYFGSPSLSGNTPYDYYMELNNPYSSMVPSILGDISNLSGIAGQNSATPAEKAFGVHYFQWCNNLYYDPSYGVNYTDDADFQSKSVAGYFVPVASHHAGKPAVAVKPVGASVEVHLSH